MSRDESRRSKRCRTDRDYELGPAAGIMVNDYDDERTLDEEEALEGSEDSHNELSHLQKESNMPLKELLVMYGYGDMSCQDPNKAEDEEDEEEDEEEEEDDEDEDDDDPANYESDLKQFYTEMVKDEATGASVKRPPTAKSDEIAKSGETAALASNTSAQSNPANFEPETEDRTMGATGDASGDAQNPSSTADVGPSAENANSTTGVPASGNVGTGGGGGGSGSSRLLRSVSRPQSEEEEDDCDYSPDEEEWKKTIMVGSDYQAAIPEGLCKYDDALPYENEDKILWDPSPISEEAVEEFLERAQVPIVKGASLPSGSHVRDDEQALYLLLQCGYNLEEALRRRRMNVLPPTESVSLWSEEECHNFETGLRNYGKDFHLIQKNKVRTRSVGELVQFYYLWKKTERHDIFTYKARLEKKKYALHPGITDYMDRFLEEQEGVRDRSSSPNVHCLLYGDTKRQRTSANSTSNEEPSTKSTLDNWDGVASVANSSTTSATATTTTTVATTTSSDGSTATPTSVNSGPTDPLAIDHRHNSSSPVASAVDYAKANAEASSTPTPWPSSTITGTTITTSTSISSSSSSSTTSSSTMQQQQQQQQQRNHLHQHLQQQQQQQQQATVAGSGNEVVTTVGAVAPTVVAQSRSPENILPHLPP